MALVVEDGSGLTNADSLLSVTGADTYHTSFNNTAWDSADNAQKESALRYASQYLRKLIFYGNPVTSGQALSFPRNGIYLKDGSVTYEADVLPNDVLNAVAELALEAYQASQETGGRLEQSAKGAVKREKVGPLETEYHEVSYLSGVVKQISIGGNSTTDRAMSYLAPYLSIKSSSGLSHKLLKQ